MRGDGADRIDDTWLMSDGSSALAASLDDVQVENNLLLYAQRSAARTGAEWFAAEFQRREEDEQRALEAGQPVSGRGPAFQIAEIAEDHGLVDASVQEQVVGAGPVPLGIEPRPTSLTEPAPVLRHPHVPRPPAPEPEQETRRRRRDRKRAQEPPTVPSHISAPEWARMSPGARRLYGFEEEPRATGAPTRSQRGGPLATWYEP